MNSDTCRPRIVAFTKDWEDVPTSTTHILRQMAQAQPVLWVNSIGTRRPSLRDPTHVLRALRRLRSLVRPVEHKESQLWVLTPLLIPKAQSGWAKALNRALFWRTAAKQLRRMGNGPLETWCFVPNAVDLLPVPADRTPTLVVYYCTDDWPNFHYLDGSWLAQREEELLRRAHVVFAASRVLQAKLSSRTATPVHYAPHGVEYEKFARARDPAMSVPAELQKLPRPIIGFYGNIYPWIEFDLIRSLAQQRPDWSFVMIGSVYCDISGFGVIRNVHFLGRREHDQLPAYCAAFDAAIIPYDIRNPRMQSVSPVKVRELLAAGVPVAAADIPELRGLSPYVVICHDPAEWIGTLERLVTLKERCAISESVRADSWESRVSELRRIISLVRSTCG
ncbi:MAG: glycosyltransferase [Kiritimatiellia bacterium]